MLPGSSIALCMSCGKVQSRPDKSRENAADDSANTVALGPGDADCGVRALRAHSWSGGTDELPDRAAGRRRAQRARDRLAGSAWVPPGAQSAASVSVRGPGWLGSTQSAWTSTRGHTGLAGGVATSDRPGPAQCRCAQRGVDDSAAVRLPGTSDRPPHWDRNRSDPPASTGLRVQTTDLVVEAQVDRTGWVGKKRLRVEVLLAAAASPVPPPIDELLPDPLLCDEVPEDLSWLLRLLPRADVYLQDEVEVALHPTLTRVWSPKGRRRQSLVETPGNNENQYGFGLVDWRDGWLDWERAPGRRAAPLCAQLRRAVARSQARGRIAVVLLDNLGIHTPKGSLLLRQLLTELRGQLVLVYTPAYDPESNRIEWLWRSLRRAVTHTHTRKTLPPLLEDADSWAATISPMAILRQIGSPFADIVDPIQAGVLEHAA